MENSNLCKVDSNIYYNYFDYYIKHDCSKCVENASLIDDVCQCDSGYSGIGYIYCSNENETEESNNFYLFDSQYKFYNKYCNISIKLIIYIIILDSIIEECKVINELIKKDYFYCCDLEGISCDFGHITKM